MNSNAKKKAKIKETDIKTKCVLLPAKKQPTNQPTLPKKANNETNPTLGFVLANLDTNFRENSEIGYR